MKRTLVLLMMALLPAACGGDRSADRVPLDGSAGTATVQQQPGSTMSPEVRAHVESGNAAYRAGNYQEALDQYQAATRLGPNEATAWYGVAMAAGAIGNQELADSAGMRVHQLNPDLGFGRHPGPGEGGEVPVAPHP